MSGVLVRLTGGARINAEGVVREVPEAGVRLLALIGLAEGPLDRRHVAGTLWPDIDETHGAGRLRTALWRLRTAGVEVVVGDRTRLWLETGTDLDVHRIRAWTARVLAGAAPDEPWLDHIHDLLPGLDDDWLVFERERLRLRVLPALEALSHQLIRVGRCAEATEAALVAVRTDPLRESARTALIRAYLAENNLAAAARNYHQYRLELSRELGVSPGPEVTGLLEGALALRRGTASSGQIPFPSPAAEH